MASALVVEQHNTVSRPLTHSPEGACVLRSITRLFAGLCFAREPPTASAFVVAQHNTALQRPTRSTSAASIFTNTPAQSPAFFCRNNRIVSRGATRLLHYVKCQETSLSRCDLPQFFKNGQIYRPLFPPFFN
jgi:hypothetical protein